jgi:oxygen-independent coproporphyrinogen-3 oxidase
MSVEHAERTSVFADWTYYPELLARPVPRYTSYPTAAEFVDEDFEARQRAAIRAVRGTVSLYIHIPYCREICWYCGCNTGCQSHATSDALIEALHHEIELLARTDPSVRISRIAFGGQPQRDPADRFRAAGRYADGELPDGPAGAVDRTRPAQPSSPWLMAIRGIGVIKASLGVQTLDARVQSAIGRVQPKDLIERAGRAAPGGRGSINFDLMYGLPFQDDAVLAQTLDETIAMGADRVALFAMPMPHMIPRQQRIDASRLPGQVDRFRMAAEGYRQLVDAGYQAVGFDHFALPGDDLARAARTGALQRNFQGFTDDPRRCC